MKRATEMVFTLDSISNGSARLHSDEYQWGVSRYHDRLYHLDKGSNLSVMFKVNLDVGVECTSEEIWETLDVVEVTETSITFLDAHSLFMHTLDIGDALTVGISLNTNTMSWDVISEKGNPYANWQYAVNEQGEIEKQGIIPAAQRVPSEDYLPVPELDDWEEDYDD